jgi:hypothetical protein
VRLTPLSHPLHRQACFLCGLYDAVGALLGDRWHFHQLRALVWLVSFKDWDAIRERLVMPLLVCEPILGDGEDMRLLQDGQAVCTELAEELFPVPDAM